MASLLSGISHAEYHADSIPGHPGPHFSRSVAVDILQSPKLAYHNHPLLGGAGEEIDPDPQAQARKERGALFHQLLLGGGLGIAVVDANDFKSDAAKKARNEARANGLLPVVAPKYHAAMEALPFIKKSLLELDIDLGEWDTEVTALWGEGGTPCKGRLDALSMARGKILDLKCITGRINPQGFEGSLLRYGNDIQAFSYPAGVAAINPALAGRIDLDFVLIETTPPYDAALQPIGASKLSIGERRWKRSLRLWQQHLASGAWPGVGVLPPLEAKPWELEREMMAEYEKPQEPGWAKGE